MDRNSNWDVIGADTEKVAEFEGGERYRHEGIDLLVLSGSYKEIGRQYGTLLEEKPGWVRIPTVSSWMEFDLKEYFTAPEGRRRGERQTSGVPGDQR